MKRFAGFTPAVFTPFTSEGALYLDRIPDLYALLDESSIECAFIGGTTGEFPSLSTEERMALAEAWVKSVPDSFSVWVHVGHNAQTEAVRLARHAASVGARAISALAPTYFKPAGVEALIDFLAPIAGAAPDLPFYYYEIPSMTGVSIAPESVLAAGLERIPTLAGLKFSSNNLFQLQKCLAAAPEKDLLFGSDEMLLAAMTLGATGAIGSTYNVAAPLYHRMLEAFRAGRISEARRLQHQSARFVDLLSDFGLLPAQKAVLKMLGVDCGPVRAPLRSLESAQERQLYEKISAMDIFPRSLKAPT